MKPLKELRPLRPFLLVALLFLIASCEVYIYDTPPHQLNTQDSYRFYGRLVDNRNVPMSSVKVLVNHWGVLARGDDRWYTLTTDYNGYFDFTVSGGREGVLIVNGVLLSRDTFNYSREGDNLFFDVVIFNFATPPMGSRGGGIVLSKGGKKPHHMKGAKPFDFRVGRTPMGKDFFSAVKKYQEEDFKGAAKAGERYLKRYPNAGSERRRGDIERLVNDANTKLKSNKNSKRTKHIGADKDKGKAKESSWDVDKRRRLAKEHKVKKDNMKALKEPVGEFADPPVPSKGKVVKKNNHVNINVPSVSTDSPSEKVVKMTVPLDVPKENILSNKPKPSNRGNGDNRKEKTKVPGCASVITMAVYWSAPNSYVGRCVELHANFVERLSNRSAIYVAGADRIVLNAANRPLGLGGFNGIVRAIGKSKVGKKGKGELLEHFNVLISN